MDTEIENCQKKMNKYEVIVCEVNHGNCIDKEQIEAIGLYSAMDQVEQIWGEIDWEGIEKRKWVEGYFDLEDSNFTVTIEKI